MLDPDTDQDGGQPVYADSLRFSPSLDRQLHGLQVRARRRLYVQTYDGFFRAGPNVGLWRVEYTGGPDTPNANPTADRDRRPPGRSSRAPARAACRTSGTSATARTSDEANPTHTYPGPGLHGQADRDLRRRRPVLEDRRGRRARGGRRRPRRSRRRARPGAARPRRHLHPARSRSRWRDRPDGRHRRRHAPSTGSTAATFQTLHGARSRARSPATYTVEFRSTDGAGNVEATKSVSFTIAITAELPDGPQRRVQRADARPEVGDPARRRRRPAASMNGALHMLVRDGDMIGGTATAQNVLLQPAPARAAGPRRRRSASQTSRTPASRPGLVLWQSENPNNFAKIVFINKGNGTRWFEYVLTDARRDGRGCRTPGRCRNIAGRRLHPRDQQRRRDGSCPSGSIDGEPGTPIGSPDHRPRRPT